MIFNQYLDYLENRSILDRVLDDCKEQSAQIKAELEECKNKKLPTQPELLNPA